MMDGADTMGEQVVYREMAVREITLDMVGWEVWLGPLLEWTLINHVSGDVFYYDSDIQMWDWRRRKRIWPLSYRIRP